MTSDTRPAVLELIGNTPLVPLTRFETGPCTLLLKLESQNPGGSIKDRIGLTMVEAAERDGRLKPGGTVVEATAGNTGLGLALTKSFAEMHGGYVTIDSAVGVGTTVSIFLPLSPELSSAAQRRDPAGV